MKTTTFLSSLLILLIGSCSLFAEDRPNILWITSEDNSPYIGCYGDPLAKTPTIDEIKRLTDTQLVELEHEVLIAIKQGIPSADFSTPTTVSYTHLTLPTTPYV